MSFVSRTACLIAAAAVLAFVGGAQRVQAEASLLVEADTGKVLHAENATLPWYPASVTKLMTAYSTLRAVKEGKLGLDSLVTVSPRAASQAPTKMGFKAGTQVTVDNSLKMIMVKSANDMAMALAERVGGSVEGFSEMMNTNARRLGMTQTNYVNPNGLPDEAQITSARDLAILARALIREFPEYEAYWHISAIRLGKRVMRNYNSLIDRYPGADGMKTGFVCMSGYNLVASATRNGKRLIAVVLGSYGGAVRAQKAAQLLERGFNGGSLSWLKRSLGTVDALVPVANAVPINMKDEVCGKHRKRPASEDNDEEEEPAAEGTAENPDGSGNSSDMPQRAFSLLKQPKYVLGPAIPAAPPIDVYVGPMRKPGEPLPADPLVAEKKGSKRAKIAKKKEPAPAVVAEPAAATPAAKPKPAGKKKEAADVKPAVGTAVSTEKTAGKPKVVHAASGDAKPKAKPAVTAETPKPKPVTTEQ